MPEREEARMASELQFHFLGLLCFVYSDLRSFFVSTNQDFTAETMSSVPAAKISFYSLAVSDPLRESSFPFLIFQVHKKETFGCGRGVHYDRGGKRVGKLRSCESWESKLDERAEGAIGNNEL